MDNIGNSRQRKQRRNLSLEDKINIVKRKETDVRLSDEKLANELGVDRSTISGILRKEEKLLRLHANAKNSDLNEYLEVDNDLVSTELPTEEDIFEEFFMAEGVLQQHGGGNNYF